MLQPATDEEVNDLVHLINLIDSSSATYEMDVARAKAAANRLKSSDAYSAYSLLGMIACIENQPDDSVANHERALRLASTETWGISSYGMSMKKLSRFDEAMDLLKKAYGLAQGNKDYLDVIIDISISSGHISEAGRWLDEWNKISPDQESGRQFIYDALIRKMAAKDVSDDILIRYFDLARGLLAKKNLVPQAEIYRHGEGSDDLSYVIQVPADTDAVVDLNIELSEMLVDNDLVPDATSVMTVDFLTIVKAR